jgi:hypothetical protein
VCVYGHQYVKDVIESCFGQLLSSFVHSLGWVESVVITLLVGSIVQSGLGAA